MDEAEHVVKALQRMLDGARAEDVVRDVLRSLPHLDQQGRARVSRRLYATCVLRARLAYQASSERDVDVTDAPALLDAYVRFEENHEPLPRDWPTDPIERIAAKHSAPRFLVEELAHSLGLDETALFLAASNVPAPAHLRANTLKTTRDTLRARLHDEGIATEPHPLVDTALVVQGRGNLFGSAAWREGLFEVQDASSQLCARLCRARAGDVVVDLCAGRGGKTLALAAEMNNAGRLHVHDVDPRALADMTPRLARAGVTNVVVGLPPVGTANVVLVDAPCSSLGPLRRSPDLRWRLTPDELAAFPPLQRALLDEGKRLLRPPSGENGGRLVYATCTVRRAENDDVVGLVAGPAAITRLLLPHVDNTDGFFVAQIS